MWMVEEFFGPAPPFLWPVWGNVACDFNHGCCGVAKFLREDGKNKILTSILRHLLSGYIGIGLWDCAVQGNSLALANLKKIKRTMN